MACWSEEERQKHVIAVEEEKVKLADNNLSAKQQHEKLLQFLKENGMRALGKPRIDIYVNKLKPEVIYQIIPLQHDSFKPRDRICTGSP